MYDDQDLGTLGYLEEKPNTSELEIEKNHLRFLGYRCEDTSPSSTTLTPEEGTNIWGAFLSKLSEGLIIYRYFSAKHPDRLLKLEAANLINSGQTGVKCHLASGEGDFFVISSLLEGSYDRKGFTIFINSFNDCLDKIIENKYILEAFNGISEE